MTDAQFESDLALALALSERENPQAVSSSTSQHGGDISTAAKPHRPYSVKVWDCIVCTFMNAEEHLACGACGSVRPGDARFRLTEVSRPSSPTNLATQQASGGSQVNAKSPPSTATVPDAGTPSVPVPSTTRRSPAELSGLGADWEVVRPPDMTPSVPTTATYYGQQRPAPRIPLPPQPGTVPPRAVQHPPRQHQQQPVLRPLAPKSDGTYDRTRCATCSKSFGVMNLFKSTIHALGRSYHPDCFLCAGCQRPLREQRFKVGEDNEAYHNECYKELFHPRCRTCGDALPSEKTKDGEVIRFKVSRYWGDKYCPRHEGNTPMCCSCERLQVDSRPHLDLSDGRHICPDCVQTVQWDTQMTRPLMLQMYQFFAETLGLPIRQEIPLLLVESSTLNDHTGTSEGRHQHHNTRGLCLSEVTTVRHVMQRPVFSGNIFSRRQQTQVVTLSPVASVSAILILYGLPYEVTGGILAHEMMHAYIRLSMFPRLSPFVEEGLCQVAAYLWLTRANATTPTHGEPDLVKFSLYQLENEESEIYGDGFRAAITAHLQYGLPMVLEHVRKWGNFPA